MNTKQLRRAFIKKLHATIQMEVQRKQKMRFLNHQNAQAAVIHKLRQLFHEKGRLRPSYFDAARIATKIINQANQPKEND